MTSRLRQNLRLNSKVQLFQAVEYESESSYFEDDTTGPHESQSDPECRAVQLTGQTRLTDRSCQLPKPTDSLYNRLRLIRSTS